MPPRAEEERIRRSHDPGGAFFVRLNSFAFSFRYIIKKKPADAWSVCRKLPKNHWLKEKTRGAKAAFASFVCLFVVADRWVIFRFKKSSSPPKKNLSSLPKKRRPIIDFVLVKPHTKRLEKKSFFWVEYVHSPKPNKSSRLFLYNNLFFCWGKKAHTF